MEHSKQGLLFLILVDKVREQVLEWTSPLRLPQHPSKCYIVPSPEKQEGYAVLSHMLFLFVLM